MNTVDDFVETFMRAPGPEDHPFRVALRELFRDIIHIALVDIRSSHTAYVDVETAEHFFFDQDSALVVLCAFIGFDHEPIREDAKERLRLGEKARKINRSGRIDYLVEYRKRIKEATA